VKTGFAHCFTPNLLIMKKLIVFFSFIVIASSLNAQFVYKIKADSVLITKDTCPAELILENRTKDTLGFLYNKGNGRTEFRRGVIKLTDSTYLFGNDIINFKNLINNLGTGGSGVNIYNSNGTLTSNRFLNLDTSTLSFGKGSNINFHVANNGNVWLGHNPLPVTASAGLTLSHIISSQFNAAKGVVVNDSLIASSNTDTLVALDINPQYNLNGNNNVFPVDLRTYNTNVVFGSRYGYRQYGNENDGAIQFKAAATTKTQIILRPSAIGAYNGNWWGTIEMDGSGKMSILSPNYGSGLFLQTPSVSGSVHLGGYGSNYGIRIVSQTKNMYMLSSNVSIGAAEYDDSTAILKLVSSTKGFLPPVWTQSQRLAIDGISTGLMGYQSNAGGNTENLYVYKSTGWKRVLTEDDSNNAGPLVLATGTASNTATLNINLSSYYTLYDIIVIELMDVQPVTDGAVARLRVSSDGTNYDAGTGNYKYAFIFHSSANTNAPFGETQNHIAISGVSSGVDNASSSSFNSTITIYNPGLSTRNPNLKFSSSYFNNTGEICTLTGSGSRSAAQVTRGLQLSFSTGNIATVKYKIIGTKN
jgi:hypothetical protein